MDEDIEVKNGVAVEADEPDTDESDDSDEEDGDGSN